MNVITDEIAILQKHSEVRLPPMPFTLHTQGVTTKDVRRQIATFIDLSLETSAMSVPEKDTIGVEMVNYPHPQPAAELPSGRPSTPSTPSTTSAHHTACC